MLGFVTSTQPTRSAIALPCFHAKRVAPPYTISNRTRLFQLSSNLHLRNYDPFVKSKQIIINVTLHRHENCFAPIFSGELLTL